MPMRGALHVRACDEAFPIGPAPPRESYLEIDALDRGRAPRRRAMHPSRAMASCRRMPNSPRPALRAGIVFVGPPPAAIRAMGLKDRAKALMEKAGVPVVPGYHGDAADAEPSSSARPMRSAIRC